MKRAIVTYAEGAHEELLDVALPTFNGFAQRYNYDVIVGTKLIDRPAPWNKIPLIFKAFQDRYDEVVWLDCDLVIVNDGSDFPPLRDDKTHALVRHFEDCSEVPNSGVWRLQRCDSIEILLVRMLQLDVFTNHGWWEQAALLTLMGYCVPPEGSHFPDTRCRCVYPTRWHKECQFMRLRWNSHPNYRAEYPRIVHCSYSSMPQRLEVMRALVKDPTFNYPKFSKDKNDDALPPLQPASPAAEE